MHDNKRLEYELDRLSRGELGAFHDVIAAAHEPLVRFAHSVLRGRLKLGGAETLVNSALGPLLGPSDEAKDAKRPKFEGVGQFFSYMHEVVQNKLKDRIRKTEAEKRGGNVRILTLEAIPKPGHL